MTNEIGITITKTKRFGWDVRDPLGNFLNHFHYLIDAHLYVEQVTERAIDAGDFPYL